MGVIQNKAKCNKVLKRKHKLFKFLCRLISKTLKEHPNNKWFRIRLLKTALLKPGCFILFSLLIKKCRNYACMCLPLFKVRNR